VATEHLAGLLTEVGASFAQGGGTAIPEDEGLLDIPRFIGVNLGIYYLRMWMVDGGLFLLGDGRWILGEFFNKLHLVYRLYCAYGFESELNVNAH
jgi:hypothetical protein